PAGPVAPVVQAPTPERPTLPALLAEARRQSDTLQPHALEAWAAVARAAESVEVDMYVRAEIADHTAMGRGPEGVELFERAAELYAEAGDEGEAIAARARAAYVRALAGELDEATAAIGEPYDRILALYADDATGVRQTASVLMSRARILMRWVHERSEGAADAEQAVRELLALVGGRGRSDVRLLSRAAEGRAMLAELAEHAGDGERAGELFRQASAQFVGAELPWFAVEYELRVAALAHEEGDMGEAERALRAALEHGGPYVEPVGRAQLHLQLAEVVGGRGAAEEAVEHALEAAHWADEAGESGTLGAWARHQLGGFLLRQGRFAEAAEVLESALADLSAETHGDGAVVQTQWWLGDCLSELGEHHAAAERRLQAAEIARHWPEQHDHATLAHLAAESLGNAGLPTEADQAYTRAGELWRAMGNVHFLVRSLRARAWLALRTEAGTEGARTLMAAAVAECETALAAPADPAARERLTGELGHTHRQFGDLLARSVPEDAEDGAIQDAFEAALAEMTAAIAAFAELDEDGLHSRTGAELAAGWLEADLSRPADAAARARAVLDAYEGADQADDTVRARRAEARQLLEPTEV
ncbi:tetratricopeptide repeat protein, partial [Streptomyces sp. NPDC005917]